MNEALWHDDNIQFPRLLTELAGYIDADNLDQVARNMDLSVLEVDILFARARKAFEVIKQNLTTGGTYAKFNSN